MMRNDQKVNVCPFGVILEPLVYINNTSDQTSSDCTKNPEQ